MKIARITAILLGVLLALLSALRLVIWRESSMQARRAGQMLQELGQLELGPSGSQSALAVVQRYGGTRAAYAPLAFVNCNDGDEFYALSIRQTLPDRIIGAVPLIARTGLVRYWQVNAAVQFKNGQLVCVGALVYFPHAHASAVYAAVTRARPSEFDAGTGKAYDVSFQTPQEVLAVTVYPEANQAQRTGAFEPDLSCLSRLRGCSYPCELSPSAWQYYQTTPSWQHLVLGYGKPPDADDPQCSTPPSATPFTSPEG
jgi:hypothetical protein